MHESSNLHVLHGADDTDVEIIGFIDLPEPLFGQAEVRFRAKLPPRASEDRHQAMLQAWRLAAGAVMGFDPATKA